MFQGVLGVNTSKMVELSNPSSKKVGYTVSIDGSSEFSIAKYDIILPPDSTLNFPITLKPIFSLPPATGTITFLGCRDLANGISPGATMVFQLNSEVVGRRPIEKYTRNVPLFELDSVQVTITNPFTQEGHFVLSLAMTCKSVSADTLVQYALKGKPVEKVSKKNKIPVESLNYTPIVPPVPPPSPLKGTANGRPIPVEVKSDEEIEIESICKEPYWFAGETQMVLAPGGSKTITVHFLPLASGTHNCQVHTLRPCYSPQSFNHSSHINALSCGIIQGVFLHVTYSKTSLLIFTASIPFPHYLTTTILPLTDNFIGPSLGRVLL